MLAQGNAPERIMLLQDDTRYLNVRAEHFDYSIQSF